MSHFRQVNDLDITQVNLLLDMALLEDSGRGDITTSLLIPANMVGSGEIMANATGVLAGLPVAQQVFQRVDPSLKVTTFINDGARIKPGDIIATVNGRLASILKAERVALNFIQKMSGIASITAQYVSAIRGLGVKIADTRKTTPGLRLLEKYAVNMGGGYNHRFDLGDAVLIKDNHIAALRNMGMSLNEIITKAKQTAPEGIDVEVEATTEQEAREAVQAGAAIIMLDNMTPDEINYIMEFIKGRAEVEASGGITLDNVRQVAMAGVDFISVGALTHSVKSLDIKLEIDPDSIKLL